MESEMRSIGRLARESGLTVSALRFYDGAGVFGPAWVDPQSGYRWYAPDQLADARLICRLRRVGLPLADIRLVLAEPAHSEAARRALDAHLRRLEDGLADARRELSCVRDLLDQREHPMSASTTTVRLAVESAELAAALAAVRFAVSTDPELPMLGGVLFDLDGDVLHLVATDRYRIAVAQATVRRAADSAAAEAVQALLPVALADEIRALAEAVGAEQLTLLLDGGRVAASADGQRAEGDSLDLDFPDYRRLLRLETTHRAGIEAAELRRAVAQGPTRTSASAPDGDEVAVTVLAVDEAGNVRVAEDAVGADAVDEGAVDEDARTAQEPDGLRVAVNREFLLEALAAGVQGQLILELGGAISPLAIRPASGDGSFSLLMPIRLG
ncbi:DNA polymerase III subunit beta family protein [Kitasatospora mediocidica]|uniref:DNA polymerase III subunit beta family protein n=1 Tax=Kitasatospora mediocidica TaxID=58352 RepID=UPI0005620A13|nr:MerR family transcriptional regulator [Kitasatospora mediocidica]